MAPVLGGLAMIAACWLLVDNRSTLTAAQGVLFVELIPWLVIAMFLTGAGIAAVMRVRHPRPLRPPRACP